MNYLFTKAFWVGAIERAVKTFCQTLIATLGVLTATDMIDMDWREASCVAFTATLISVLTSIASGPVPISIPPPPLVPEVPAQREKTPLS